MCVCLYLCVRLCTIPNFPCTGFLTVYNMLVFSRFDWPLYWPNSNSNQSGCRFALHACWLCGKRLNCEMGEDRKVIIYVWVRQMSQPLSSSLWQSWALIHLLADCKRGGKKKDRNHRSSSPAWGPRVNPREEAFIFILHYCPLFAPPPGQTVMRGKK